MDKAVRLAEIQANREMIGSAAKTIESIFTNPMVVLILGYAAIEYLQGHDEYYPLYTPTGAEWRKRRVAGGGWFGSVAGTTAETALAAASLAPSAIELAKQLKPLMEAVAPVAGKALIAGAL